jgi:hypothetical protein
MRDAENWEKCPASQMKKEELGEMSCFLNEERKGSRAWQRKGLYRRANRGETMMGEEHIA